MPETQRKEKEQFYSSFGLSTPVGSSSLACAVVVPLQRVSLPFLQQKIQEIITAPDRQREEERDSVMNVLTQVCKLAKVLNFYLKKSLFLTFNSSKNPGK